MKIQQCIVSEAESIRTAIKQMDKAGIGFIAIVDQNDNVIGIVTDGDFRRAILDGVSLGNKIISITNKDFYHLSNGYDQNEPISYFKEPKASDLLPVLEDGKLIDIVFNKYFVKDDIGILNEKKLDLPVVIMAGGKGTRLDPFTRILPKALIPIDEKPIIEIIMGEYAKYGMRNFFVSINHKQKMIQAYFEDNSNNYDINYLKEDKPLGTAGALRLVDIKNNIPLFVSNCDVILKADFAKILEYHKKNKYDLTIVCSMRHQTIPYGVCLCNSEGLLTNIKEKPIYDFLVNTGVYLINSEKLSYIPENKFYDMTDFINMLQKKNCRVGVYPISEKSWVDIGQWKEYEKIIKHNIDSTIEFPIKPLPST
tara:strand:- start:4202 stop:5302 length:1101 start_codon:yes stop_codon:yes gene_type:complete